MSQVRSRDGRLLLKQVYYEQLAFWRNPFGAVFTVGFSLVFLVLLALSGGDQHTSQIGNLKEIQYNVPAFAAYGVMSACFNMLAISQVGRRETGLLKRLRLSPLPTWAMVASLYLNALLVTIVQVVILFIVGKFAFHVELPHNMAPVVLAVVVGSACFTALGIGASTLVPNEDAAGPMISIVYFVLLFLSGLWFPLKANSALAKISGYFPVRPLIIAMFRPFFLVRGVSPWDWHDLMVIAIWGVGGAIVAVRRYKWEPRRNR